MSRSSSNTPTATPEQQATVADTSEEPDTRDDGKDDTTRTGEVTENTGDTSRAHDHGVEESASCDLDVVALLSKQARDWDDDPSDENSIKYISTMNDWVEREAGRLGERCPPGVTLDDVRSLVFERLWRQRADRLPRDIPGTPITALLGVMFRNAGIDLYRRARRHRMVDLDEALTEPSVATGDDTADVVAQHEQERQLLELVAQLPEKQRTVLQLSVNGLSPKEISEHTGDGGSGVRMNLKRARLRIAERLGEVAAL